MTKSDLLLYNNFNFKNNFELNTIRTYSGKWWLIFNTLEMIVFIFIYIPILIFFSLMLVVSFNNPLLFNLLLSSTLLVLLFILPTIAYKFRSNIINTVNNLLKKINNKPIVCLNNLGFEIQDNQYKWDDISINEMYFVSRHIEPLCKNILNNKKTVYVIDYSFPSIFEFKNIRENTQIRFNTLDEYETFIKGLLYFYFHKKLNKRYSFK